MKRKPELIRKILLYVEQQPIGIGVNSLEFENYELSTVNEHIRLLKEANYIDAMVSEGFNQMGEKVVINYNISRLTNEGHDFIANAKNESVWEQAMNHVQDKVGDVSLTVLKAVLAKFALSQLGL